MWRLKIGVDGNNDPYLFSTNNVLGRQVRELDPDAGTPEKRAEVEEARQNYFKNRFNFRVGSDLFWHMQLNAYFKRGKFKQIIPQIMVGDEEEITYETETTALRRAVNMLSAMLSSHGHWLADNSGSLFYLTTVILCLYIAGYLNIIFSAQHRKQMLRYIDYHRNEDGQWGLHVKSRSKMFGTVIDYICIRLLRDEPHGGKEIACTRARKWTLDNGGAAAIPS